LETIHVAANSAAASSSIPVAPGDAVSSSIRAGQLRRRDTGFADDKPWKAHPARYRQREPAVCRPFSATALKPSCRFQLPGLPPGATV